MDLGVNKKWGFKVKADLLVQAFLHADRTGEWPLENPKYGYYIEHGEIKRKGLDKG